GGAGSRAHGPVVLHGPLALVHHAEGVPGDAAGRVGRAGAVGEDQQPLPGGRQLRHGGPAVLPDAGPVGPVQHVGEAVDAGEFGAEHLLVDVVLLEHGDELVGVGAQEVHDPLEVDPQGDGPADQGAAVVAEDRTVRGLLDVQHETADAVGELAFDALGLAGDEVDGGRGEAAVDAVGVGVVGGEEGDLVQGAAVRGRHRGGDGPGRGEVPGGEVVRPGADGERGRVDGAGGLGGDGEAVAGARGGEGEA